MAGLGKKRLQKKTKERCNSNCIQNREGWKPDHRPARQQSNVTSQAGKWCLWRKDGKTIRQANTRDGRDVMKSDLFHRQRGNFGENQASGQPSKERFNTFAPRKILRTGKRFQGKGDK